jgi:hypothetical protein
MSAIPSTYTTARPNTWSGGAARRAPKIDTVTPSIGYTHGVRLSASPIRNSVRNAVHDPLSSRRASGFSTATVPAPPGGGPVVKPELGVAACAVSAPATGLDVVSVADAVPGAAPPVTVIAIATGIVTGAMHTWSLQLW